MKTKRPAKKIGVAAVERALDILSAFRPEDISLSLSEIAERTGYYKSTILRLIVSLERRDCIHQLEDKRYQLGPALMHWGTLYQAALKLDAHVLPVMRKLVEEAGEGVSFFTRQGQTRLCLFRIDASRSIRDHVRQGDILPLDRGAAGRVLLVFDSAARKTAWPDPPIIVTIGEREPDIAALAAPVFGIDRSLRGALAISGPSSRFSSSMIARNRKLLLEAAKKLTGRLGGDISLF